MFGKKEHQERVIPMSRILEKVDREIEQLHERPRVVAVTRQTADHPFQHKSAVWKTAWWMRSLRFEDALAMATALHTHKGINELDTPEKIARWMNEWAILHMEQEDANEHTGRHHTV